MYKHILIPTDGSSHSTEMVHQGVKLAKALGAKVTFFYFKEDSSKSLLGESALLYSMAPGRYAEKYEWRQCAVLWKAEAEALNMGVEFDSVTTSQGSVAEAILLAAEQQGCDLIFLASRGRSNSLSMMLGSVTLKVLTNSAIPVHVSDSGKLPASAMARAITVIRDEHRSLLAVLHGLSHLVTAARQSNRLPDWAVVRAIHAYLVEFSTQLHHPKEEDYLFRKLRQRGASLSAQIDELCRQHIEEPKLIQVLEDAMNQAKGEGATALGALAAAVESLLQNVCHHMAMEELVILPAALEALHEDDWLEIERAFLENGDPRFGAETAEEFRILFGRIANLFPAPRVLSANGENK